MTDDKECKSCAILRRYEKTARERGYAMGKAAGNNELAQVQELLAFERKAHAETNAALTAEITRLEAQLAAAAPGKRHAPLLDELLAAAERDGITRLPIPAWDDTKPVCCWKCANGGPVMQMVLCPTCGNKRCPKASNHELACTGSNEPGQPGSVY